MLRKKKHVLLLIETSMEYGRGIISGIVQYVQERENWNIYFEDRGLNEASPVNFSYWDGIISRSSDPSYAKALQNSGVPTIELLATDETTQFPAVMDDSAAICELAIEHFLQRRLKHFAFFSLFNVWWSLWKGKLFVDSLARRGYKCSVFNCPEIKGTDHPPKIPFVNRKFGRDITKWLLSFPKPAGLLVPTDSHAMYVFEACHSRGISIPQEIAILGVSNDKLFCNALTPTLSSIDMNPKPVGYRAAELLDLKMEGKTIPPKPVFIPPAYVVSRESTNILNVDDPKVIAAMQYIRENISGGITVRDLTKELHLSRSTLERRFRKSLGTTPSDEIKRHQMEKAKELLRETDFSVTTISQLCGFFEVDYFVRTFKSNCHQTPNQYRSAFNRANHEE